MANPIRFFLFLIAILIIFNCGDNLFEDMYSEELSTEEEVWLNDDDGDGVADSLDKYAKDCGDPIKVCLRTARENKKKEETRIQDSLRLAEVKFSLPGGLYEETVKVKLTTASDGIIRYTTNGLTPSEESAVYDGPIPITATTVLKSRSFSKNNDAGPVQSEEYELRVKTPTASKKKGSYTEPIKVSLACETEETAIFYTLDGSKPSTVLSAKFRDRLEIKNSTTLKARAAREGWTPSDILEAYYRINIPGTVIGPVFTPKAGVFNEPQEVSLTSETKGAKIMYTLDGKTPDASSKVYSNKIMVDSGMTIRAVAIKEGMETSAAASAKYILRPSKPMFDPPAGDYDKEQSITITVKSPASAKIYYTTNGGTPSDSSLIYKKAILVSKNMTLKAIAFKTNWAPSEMGEEQYTINIPGKVSAPVFDPAGGSFSDSILVNISADRDTAKIYYTTNGEVPSESDTRFESEFFIYDSRTLKAIAVIQGGKTSDVAEALFKKINTLPSDISGPSITLVNPLWKDTTVTSAVVTIDVRVQDTSGVKSVTMNGEEASLSGDKYSQTLTLSSGENKIIVMAEDKSANRNTSADTLRITYDPPVDTVESDISGPSITLVNPLWKDTTVTSAVVTIDVRVQDTSGVKSVTINGAEAYLSGDKYSQTLTLSFGENKIIVMAEDKSANRNTSADTLRITYDPPVDTVESDISGPSITLVNPLWKDTTVTSAVVTIDVRVQDTSGVKSVTMNGEEASLSGDKYSQTLTLSSGENKIIVMAEDKSANRNTSADTLRITYDPPVDTVESDISGPSITLVNPLWKDTTVTSAVVTIDVRVQDTSGVKSVTINGAEAYLSGDKYSQTLTLSFGENKIIVMAEDKSANRNTSADTLRITYDPPPNSVTLLSPTRITGKGMLVIWSQSDDKDFQAYKIYYSTSPLVSTSDTLAYVELNKRNNTYIFSGLASKNTYYVKVYVFDKTSSAGSNEVSAFLNTAPVFAEVAGQSVYENKELSFTISASDSDGDGLSYSMLTPPVLDGRPAFDGGTKSFSWTPTYTDAGSYVAKFEVTDNLQHPGRDTLVVNITVKNYNSDSLIVRNLLDDNGFSSLAVNDNICKYANERVVALYLDSGRIHGQLTSLPAAIQNLTELKKLDLNYNKLTSLPDEIGNLINLTELYIDGNQLSGLPSGIVNLTNLTYLTISGNKLCDLSETIKTWINTYSKEPDWERHQSCSIPDTTTIKDIEGNIYDIITIGTQTWMAENLKTATYNDGKAIPLVTNGSIWSSISTPAYCWYGNDETNKNVYGALYNFIAVKTAKLCPTGWHVPTNAEWIALIDYLGGADVAADKLMESGTLHWRAPNNATNQSGFTALPGGYRTSSSGAFVSLGVSAYLWSSTNVPYQIPYSLKISPYGAVLYVRETQNGGYSVRCMQD